MHALLTYLLDFQFLHSLPFITLLFLCFTHNLQVIQLSSESKCRHLYSFDHFCWKQRTLYALLNNWETVYFHFHFCGWVGKGLILFDCWRFWFVVLCGKWEAVELGINNLLFQSVTFLWCRALIVLKKCSLFSSSTQPLLNIRTPFPIYSQEPMKTQVTSVYRAPANKLTNYDFIIGH